MYVCIACILFMRDELEPIPEENPEEPGQEADAADAYESEGKSHWPFDPVDPMKDFL